jgi:hypothetical protein
LRRSTDRSICVRFGSETINATGVSAAIGPLLPGTRSQPEPEVSVHVDFITRRRSRQDAQESSLARRRVTSFDRGAPRRRTATRACTCHPQLFDPGEPEGQFLMKVRDSMA